MSVINWLVNRYLLHNSGGRLTVDWCTAVLPQVESTPAYSHGSFKISKIVLKVASFASPCVISTVSNAMDF